MPHVPLEVVDHCAQYAGFGSANRPTSASSFSSRRRQACPAPSTCRPRWGTTPIIPGLRLRWQGRRRDRLPWPILATLDGRPPHGQVTASMTINATGAILFSLVSIGAGRGAGRGEREDPCTIQNHISKEYIAAHLSPAAVRPCAASTRSPDCAANLPELEHDLHLGLPHP